MISTAIESSRPQSGIWGSWWWTVDRVLLLSVLSIMAIGAMMVTTASPAVALRIGLSDFYFLHRQLLFLSIALLIMVSISLLSPRNVKRMAILGLVTGVGMLLLVLFSGVEIKGARRWIDIAGISLQPSEFVKPCLIVVTAWLLSKKQEWGSLLVYKTSALVFAGVVGLVALQPDVGMASVMVLVYGGQLFLAGLPFIWIILAAGCAVAAFITAYNVFPHVEQRVNSFLDSAETGYQVRRSLEAFTNGGWFGKGPGEGTVKQYLPDSHTDFIFAVLGEEMGLIACVAVLALFATIVIRSFFRALNERDLFIVYAVAGLAMQFGLQAIINMAVTLHMMPTKGMTLPFISYGGSSLMAIALTVGMLLALTRKRYGNTMLRGTV